VIRQGGNATVVPTVEDLQGILVSVSKSPLVE
jgi:hypothetical protein